MADEMHTSELDDVTDAPASGVRQGLRASVPSQRAALVRLLESRGLDPSLSARSQIAACADLAALDAWLVRAVGARDEADVFG